MHQLKKMCRFMVPGAGLEPARHCWRGILSPLCLPIPPPGHKNCNYNLKKYLIVLVTQIFFAVATKAKAVYLFLIFFTMRSYHHQQLN